MATKKTTSKKTTHNPYSSPTDKEKEKINKIVKEAYEKGKIDGQQDVWKTMADFIKERMFTHYAHHEDIVAQELRKILGSISKNIT